MPLPSLRMVSTEPVMRCVNKVFLSQKAAFFQSGCDTTTRVTPKKHPKALEEKMAREGIELTETESVQNSVSR
ncbi:Uncharacterised protein [Klebsiella michiganensis]|nr:Uncharacterised protein [Klebsiella michiganensis]